MLEDETNPYWTDARLASWSSDALNECIVDALIATLETLAEIETKLQHECVALKENNAKIICVCPR